MTPKKLHALNRLTFGPAPGDMDALNRQGVESFIHDQLNPERLPEPPELVNRLSGFEAITMSPPDLFVRYVRVPGRDLPPDLKGLEGGLKKPAEIWAQPARAKLIRALMSPRQLQEILVDFWYNHFNVFSDRSLASRVWVGAYEYQAIRPFVFGKFRDLLMATARHPAMLSYLDNALNVAPDSPRGLKRSQGLNENYARELLELHTLGVDGGYSQQDVRELARILTGWGLYSPAPGRGLSAFFFDAKAHDNGQKKLLGRLYQANGQAEVEAAMGDLADHPSTSQHVCFKLARRFVSDNPPPALVARLAKRFRETDGDIRQVLESLFASDEFWATQHYGVKFKTPFHYLVSAVKALSRPVDQSWQVLNILHQWGMPLYGCVTPDGYPDTEVAWLSPGALVDRIKFMTNFSNYRPPEIPAKSPSVMAGGHEPSTAAQQDLERIKSMLGPALQQRTVDALNAAPANLRLTMILLSPEFLRY